MVRVTVGQLQVPLPWLTLGKPLNSLTLDPTGISLHKEGSISLCSRCATAGQGGQHHLAELRAHSGDILSSWGKRVAGRGDQLSQMPCVVQVLVRSLGT